MFLISVLFLVCATFCTEVKGRTSENLVCPEICPDLLDPICVTNGKDYLKFNNKCELNVFNCEHRLLSLSTYNNTDMDWCTTTELEEGLEELLDLGLEKFETLCMKPCPMLLRPVCASNSTHRIDFSNDCEMEMINCVYKYQERPEWRLLRNSSC